MRLLPQIFAIHLGAGATFDLITSTKDGPTQENERCFTSSRYSVQGFVQAIKSDLKLFEVSDIFTTFYDVCIPQSAGKQNRCSIVF